MLNFRNSVLVFLFLFLEAKFINTCFLKIWLNFFASKEIENVF